MESETPPRSVSDSIALFGSDRIRTEGLDSCFDAFSSREPVSTSLESALVALARRLFFQPRHAGTLRQHRLDVLEADATRLQQHQQMEQHVGAFGDQMLAIVFDAGDDGLDRFLAEFLSAVLRALVEQLAGVGRLPSRRRAGIDGGGKIMDGKTRHQVNSHTAPS